MSVNVIIEEGYSFHKIDIHHPLEIPKIMILVTSFNIVAEKISIIMYTESNYE